MKNILKNNRNYIFKQTDSKRLLLTDGYRELNWMAEVWPTSETKTT